MGAYVGGQNQVADALSKKVQKMVVALSVVDTNFLEKIKEHSKSDLVYLKLEGSVNMRYSKILA